MDVHLYIYDLSKGLARQYSGAFLGVHIDAIYHTAIVLDGVEYFFGAGIQTCSPPGSTHHGRPMEILRLGTTSVPKDIIATYLDDLSDTYSGESYDLFLHNCNNFTNDLSEFLVGKPIPERIESLPRRVLETPFGAMMKQQIDAAMRPVVQHSSHPPYGTTKAHKKKTMTAPSGQPSGQPAHPHQSLNLPELDAIARSSPSIPSSALPTDEELAAVGAIDQDPAALALRDFSRNFIATEGMRQQPVPDLEAVGRLIEQATISPSPIALSIILRLLRPVLSDRRVSDFFVQDSHQDTLQALFDHVSALGSGSPEDLRLITLQVIECLSSSSTILTRHQQQETTLVSAMNGLVCAALTASNADAAKDLRVAASEAALALTKLDYLRRKDNPNAVSSCLPDDQALSLASALMHAIDAEQTSFAVLRQDLAALAFLVYLRPKENDDVWEFLEISNAAGTVEEKAEKSSRIRKLAMEVVGLLGG